MRIYGKVDMIRPGEITGFSGTRSLISLVSTRGGLLTI
jgi:hypothetical protein